MDGSDEIRSHSFFSKIDWTAIEQKRVPPPFKPQLTESDDVKYFDTEFVNMPVVNSEAVEAKGSKGHFEGFTYDAAKDLASKQEQKQVQKHEKQHAQDQRNEVNGTSKSKSKSNCKGSRKPSAQNGKTGRGKGKN